MMRGAILGFIPVKVSEDDPGRGSTALFEGRSLVEHSVATAQEANVFASVVVSTDNAEAAELARRAGAALPFIRPTHLAGAKASILDVTLHALAELDRLDQRFETIVILLPSSALRTAKDICDALELYAQSAAGVLFSVTAYEDTPLRAFILEEDSLMRPLHPEWLERLGAKARGRIPRVVRANGAIVIADVRMLREHRSFYFGPIAGYEMPRERSVFIDSEIDLIFARALLERSR